MTEQSIPAQTDRGSRAGTPASQPLWVSSVTIGVPDVHRALQFWARFLGWQVTADDPPREGEPDGAGWAQVRAPEGSRGLTTINLEHEREYRTPVWPSRPGEQNVTTHLDIPVDDLDAAADRAVRAGATVAECQPQHDVRVMLDPAGHPFCLFLSVGS